MQLLKMLKPHQPYIHLREQTYIYIYTYPAIVVLVSLLRMQVSSANSLIFSAPMFAMAMLRCMHPAHPLPIFRFCLAVFWSLKTLSAAMQRIPFQNNRAVSSCTRTTILGTFCLLAGIWGGGQFILGTEAARHRHRQTDRQTEWWGTCENSVQG